MVHNYQTRFVLLSFLILLLQVGPGTAQSAAPPEWEDRVLDALTDEQAQDFLAGADPASIDLGEGETLDGLIDRLQDQEHEGLAFHPLDACIVLDTRTATEPLLAGIARGLRIRGAADPAEVDQQSGERPCRLSKDSGAEVVLLTIQAIESTGEAEVTLWPSDGAQPQDSLLTLSGFSGASTTATVRLCEADCEDADLKFQIDGAGAALVVRMLGYYASWDFGREDSGQQSQSIASDEARDRITTKSVEPPFWEAGSEGHIFYDGPVSIGPGAAMEQFQVNEGNFRLHSPVAGEVELQFVTVLGGGVTKFVKKGSSNDLNIRRGNDANLYKLGVGQFVVYTADVGIGVENPQAKLDVDGDIKLSGNIVSTNDICIGNCGQP